MKIASLIAVFGANFVSTQEDAGNSTVTTAGPRPIKTQRRFLDFRKMFYEFYTPEDLTRIYGYGCYCLNLGDRPLTGNLSGVQPVDETDALCHKWNKCNRCARHDHDETCTPEQRKYKFRVLGEGDQKRVECTDRKNSCERDLCECDKWSVDNLKKVINTTNPKYLAHKGFIAENECENIRAVPRADRGEIKCCGEYPHRAPYNTSNKQCCNNKLTFLGESCN